MRSLNELMKTSGVLCGAVQLIAAALAQAGEPLFTDDPGTPGPNRWELNVGILLADFADNTAWELPSVNLNYGIGERVEVGTTLPFLIVDNPGESPQGDFGDASVGVKWRFLDEEVNGISVSTAPAFTFNTFQRSVDRGLVDRGTVFTLPVEVGRSVGPVDLYAEAGYDFFESGTDLWFGGVAAEWGFHDRWTLVGELFGVAAYNFEDGELLANGGLRFAVRENLFVHGAAGLPLREAHTDPTRFTTYVGVQWTF